MAKLLLEIGTEELPAGYIDPALAFLARTATNALKDARLAHGEIQTFGTPRRLVMMVEHVADGQPDREEEVTGPRADIAWDKEGNLSKAGAGFLRGRGLPPEAAFRKETKKGEVIAAVVREQGQPAERVLPKLLEELIGKIPFPKTMRWTDGKTQFARPVRWLLALHGNAPLSVQFGSLTSGRVTFGHRFHAPDPIEIHSVDDFAASLETANIVLDKSERKEQILRQAQSLAKEAGGSLLEDPALLEEVANLVEKPWPLLGRFDERFLEVPKELLLSEMREHQRYFGIVDDTGKLLPAFIVVAGSEPADPERVAAGNARVLRARFEDGAFYFHDDKKNPLADRVAALDKVIFQRKLGTLLDKTKRIVAIVEHLADTLRIDPTKKAHALRAAELCKADLISGVVGEFPELQGTMGRYYAALDGESEAVATAIEEHYAPRQANAALPTTVPGALVGAADRLDTLVGILGIGKAPSGSADPFALRRAAIAVLRIFLQQGWACSLAEVVATVRGVLADKTEVAADTLEQQTLEFFRTRLRGILVERCDERDLPGANDIVDATLGAGFSDLPDVDARTEALARLRAKDLEAFASLSATFKRVGNILKKARDGGVIGDEVPVDRGALGLPAELALYEAIEKTSPGAGQDKNESETPVQYYERTLTQVAALQPFVASFFDDVMVMDEDERVRNARLGLLAAVERRLRDVADFTKIQIEN